MGELARGNLKMLPTIKVALPCSLLLATIVGRARAFDFEPRGGWGPLWINQTEPEGEIDQLGDLTVRRLGSRDLFHEENLHQPPSPQPGHPDYHHSGHLHLHPPQVRPSQQSQVGVVGS